MATPTPRHAVSLCTLLLNSSLPINHPCVYLPRCRCLCTAWIRTRPLLAVFVGVCRSRWWSLQLSRLIGRPPQGTVWHCRSRSTASVSSSPGPFSDAAFVMHVTRMYRRGHFQCARRRVIPPVPPAVSPVPTVSLCSVALGSGYQKALRLQCFFTGHFE